MFQINLFQLHYEQLVWPRQEAAGARLFLSLITEDGLH